MDGAVERHETRHEFFQRRLQELGALDADSDYEGQIGLAVEYMSYLLEEQGHSGVSLVLTVQLFNQLMHEWWEHHGN